MVILHPHSTFFKGHFKQSQEGKPFESTLHRFLTINPDMF